MSAHVLVAEDSATQAEAISGHLRDAGYTVTLARNGPEALAVLSKQSDIDLVVSDIIMPEMTGYELCRAIKADRDLDVVPVILLTTLRDPVDIVRGLAAGADNFLIKPYEPELLLSRVENAVQSRREREDGGRFRMGAEVRLLGHLFTVDVDRQQILDLLMGSFEDLVHANTRLRDQEEDLVRAREEAVATNQAKSTFVAQLAHELLNPLGVVSAYSQLLREEELSDPNRQAVEAIAKSARRMFQLIEDLRDIEGIESGQLQLDIKEVRIAPVLEEAIAQTRRLQDGHGVGVEVDGETDLALLADERRLLQVLTNLVSNAIKYNRAHGSVQVTIEATAGSARIAVVDTGRGVAAEDLSRLFVPFDRLGASSTIEGTGIGLPLAQELVHAMGGTLTVTSEPDHGSTFTVELPRARQAATDRRQP